MKTFLVFLCLTASIAKGSESIKSIRASGGSFSDKTSGMLASVETAAREELIEACGSLEQVKQINHITITLDSSSTIRMKANGVPGVDLFYFSGFPPSILTAEVVCVD